PPRRAGPGSRSPRAASGRRPSACACAAPRLLEEAPLLELAALAPVEGRDRAVVAHDARPDLAGLLFPVLLPALRARGVLAGEVAVARADGERGRDGDVGEAEALERAAHERLAGFRAREPLGHIKVQHCSAGVLRLQRLLALERLEGVVGKADRKLRRVGVVGLLVGAGLQDAGIA